MDLQLFLQILSCTAIITTIALFLCGIPICMEIMRRKGTKDISGVPFLMGVLGGSFWLRYGFLKMDHTMIIVNVVSVSLFSMYCLFYLAYSSPKWRFGIKLLSITSLIGLMLAWVQWRPNLDYLGIVCMTFNIINFGAPLAGLGVVLRKRCCDTVPLPLCVANLLVSSQWFLYGNIIRDAYIMAPNGIGMALAVLQLSLFVIFPRRENGKSVASRVAGFFSNPEDVEKGVGISTKTISTSLPIASGMKLMRKLSETLEKKSWPTDNFGVSSVQRARPRTFSVPDISKAKLV
ncbi:mtN3/saliva family protein [Dictyocaulus viviparus]|uniref:Sugar transporter SWEET n=1 Tax=Dictyocaulus viviparus TaxID=29172 RepID=A0A0D8Y4U5_DICVI|nr:mtN3/saliva family protein [Dictyocaulus viviparus]